MARRLLGDEPEQIDLLAAVELFRRLQAAGQEQLADELVELGDVPGHAVAQVRTLRAHQLQGHAYPRERRAQLVGSAGQQRALRADQRLDAIGGAVEARGQARDFVSPFHPHARAEVARAQSLHARRAAARGAA